MIKIRQWPNSFPHNKICILEQMWKSHYFSLFLFLNMILLPTFIQGTVCKERSGKSWCKDVDVIERKVTEGCVPCDESSCSWMMHFALKCWLSDILLVRSFSLSMCFVCSFFFRLTCTHQTSTYSEPKVHAVFRQIFLDSSTLIVIIYVLWHIYKTMAVMKSWMLYLVIAIFFFF